MKERFHAICLTVMFVQCNRMSLTTHATWKTSASVVALPLSIFPQLLSFGSFSPTTSLKRTDGNINYFKRLMRCKGTCEILQYYEL